MNQDLLDLMPFEPTIFIMAGYEATGLPIILKNGAKLYPKGWLRFIKITPEEVLS